MFNNNYGQPYYGGYNYMQRPQPQPQAQNVDFQNQFAQQYMKPQVLQGKAVDSIDVVKATDIPFDYTVSYFPLVDGTAIVTKQLMQDGTTKITVFKPTENTTEEMPKYITAQDLENFQPSGIKELRDEIKDLKKKIRDLTNELEDKKGE